MASQSNTDHYKDSNFSSEFKKKKKITLDVELVGVSCLSCRVSGHTHVLPTVHYVGPADHQLCPAHANVKVPVLKDVQLLPIFVPKDDGGRDTTGWTLNGDGAIHNDLVVIGHALSVDCWRNCNLF